MGSRELRLLGLCWSLLGRLLLFVALLSCCLALLLFWLGLLLFTRGR